MEERRLPPGGINVMFSSGDTLFAGTEGNGVYRTDDIGQTWSPFNTGIEEYTIWLDVDGMITNGVKVLIK